MHANDVVDTEGAGARPDVFELRLRLDWLQHKGTFLSAEMWGLELELAGVAECEGKHVDAVVSEITGRLCTPPPVSVRLTMESQGVSADVDSATYRLLRYECRED